jgi:DNA-binding transcriptional LysR family regulator
MSTMDECNNYMKDMAVGSAGELKIGTLPSLVTLLVSPALANIVKALPKVSIQITAFAPPTLYEALRHDEMDFGILLAENTPAEFHVTAIRSEPLYFVCSGSPSRMQKRRSMSIRELRDVPFVLGSPGNDYTMLIDQSLRAIGMDGYRAAVRISNFEGMKKAIRAGIGLGILPEFAVHEELKQGTLNRVHIKGANFTSRVVLIERRRVMSLPTVENVKRILVQELTNGAPTTPP